MVLVDGSLSACLLSLAREGHSPIFFQYLCNNSISDWSVMSIAISPIATLDQQTPAAQLTSETHSKVSA